MGNSKVFFFKIKILKLGWRTQCMRKQRRRIPLKQVLILVFDIKLFGLIYNIIYYLCLSIISFNNMHIVIWERKISSRNQLVNYFKLMNEINKYFPFLKKDFLFIVFDSLFENYFCSLIPYYATTKPKLFPGSF